ncbi:hypothetical protein SAMN05880574_1292 [Chryseobacterium sp. RU37D]|nr:hypothetical protein SAMN05880574_1292 [Chryseobacterium sp. RU37D]
MEFSAGHAPNSGTKFQKLNTDKEKNPNLSQNTQMSEISTGWLIFVLTILFFTLLLLKNT